MKQCRQRAKAIFAFSLFAIVAKTNPQTTKEINYPFSLSDAFLVKLQECSGSLIANDWVISAAHCFERMFNFGAGRINVRPIENNYGDPEMDFTEWNADPDNADNFIQVEKPISLSSHPEDELWTSELEESKLSQSASKDVDSREEHQQYWRKVEKIIMHQSFKGEALSWKGYDFVLIKLSDKKGGQQVSGKIIPVCLPGKKFPVFRNEQVYMAGFGRREIPHCMTDMQGPDKFQVCGRENWCEKDHRRKYCKLNFLGVDGEINHKCVNDIASPSNLDDRCRRLHDGIPSVQNTTVHLFDENEIYVTTCYPAFDAISKNPKGWCTTRLAGRNKNERPEATKGWGFCSTDPSQENCNGHIDPKMDPSSKQTSFLTEEYCINQLADNLRVEQPQAKPKEYKNLFAQSNIFCTGQNETNTLEGHRYYKMSKDNDNFEDLETHIDTSVLSESVFKGDNEIKKHYINGGPNCFGDSGGPLWRTVEAHSNLKNGSQKKKNVPVLVGVFSFLLWGTCYGAQEPAYYGQVEGILDWIHQYIEENETCIVTADENKDSNPKEPLKLNLKESIRSRIGVGTNLNNRGSSESHFLYLCVTGCFSAFITILIAWRCNIHSMQNYI